MNTWKLLVLVTATALAGCGVGVDTLSPPHETVYKYFLYVSNFSDGNLYGFELDPGTGSLSPTQPPTFDVGTTPGSPAADPLGQYLFVPEAGNVKLAVFAIDPVSGGLTPRGTQATCGTSPQAAVDPTGHMVIQVCGNFVFGFKIGSGGALTAATPDKLSLSGLGAKPGAFSQDGRHFYVPANTTQVNAISVDPAQGTLAPDVGPAPFVGNSLFQVIAHPSLSALFYVGSLNNGVIYGMTNADGTLSQSGSQQTTVANSQGLAIDPAGNFLYVTISNQSQIYKIPLDASGALQTPAAVSVSPGGLGFPIVDPTGSVLIAGDHALPKIWVYALSGSAGLTSGVATSYAIGNSGFANGVTLVKVPQP